MTPESEVARMKAAMWKQTFYVMTRTIVAPEKLPAIMLDHYNWIIDLEKCGKIFLSGPMFEEGNPRGVGMTILIADSFVEARELGASDPFCSSGAADFEVRGWQINEGRLSVTIDLSDMSGTAQGLARS